MQEAVLKCEEFDPAYFHEPRELTDEELDRLQFCDEGAMYGHDGNQERWQCPICQCHPTLTREWRWDGQKWEHDHTSNEVGITGWIECENTMRRSFREQLQREPADGKARMFASSEI